MFCTTSSAFHLEIIDYENTSHGCTREDKNLLLTSLQVIDNSRKWETIAPFLYTWEVQYLISWLKDILADREVPDRLMFTEPCISVQLSDVSPQNNTFCFRFFLLHEATPPWWISLSDKPYALSISCERVDIEQAIAHLTKQTGSFPIR